MGIQDGTGAPGMDGGVIHRDGGEVGLGTDGGVCRSRQMSGDSWVDESGGDWVADSDAGLSTDNTFRALGLQDITGGLSGHS